MDTNFTNTWHTIKKTIFFLFFTFDISSKESFLCFAVFLYCFIFVLAFVLKILSFSFAVFSFFVASLVGFFQKFVAAAVAAGHFYCCQCNRCCCYSCMECRSYC